MIVAGLAHSRVQPQPNMNSGNKSLGVILARGKSKRLPRKCLLDLNGIPLVEWSCRAAATANLTRVILSTEDEAIAACGRSAGVEVPFVRPAALAEDFASDIDIVTHAIHAAEDHYGETYQTVAIIQSTTPFIRPQHINECLDRHISGKFGCVFTVRKIADHPRWAWIMNEDGTAQPYQGISLRANEQHRQNLENVYYPNGGVWVVSPELLQEQRTIYCSPLSMVEMPWEISIDIDDLNDLLIAGLVAQKYGIQPASSERENKIS